MHIFSIATNKKLQFGWDIFPIECWGVRAKKFKSEAQSNDKQ